MVVFIPFTCPWLNGSIGGGESHGGDEVGDFGIGGSVGIENDCPLIGKVLAEKKIQLNRGFDSVEFVVPKMQ